MHTWLAVCLSVPTVWQCTAADPPRLLLCCAPLAACPLQHSRSFPRQPTRRRLLPGVCAAVVLQVICVLPFCAFRVPFRTVAPQCVRTALALLRCLLGRIRAARLVPLAHHAACPPATCRSHAPALQSGLLGRMAARGGSAHGGRLFVRSPSTQQLALLARASERRLSGGWV